VGLRAGLDAVEKEKTLALPGVEPWSFSSQAVAISTELSWLPNQWVFATFLPEIKEPGREVDGQENVGLYINCPTRLHGVVHWNKFMFVITRCYTKYVPKEGFTNMVIFIGILQELHMIHSRVCPPQATSRIIRIADNSDAGEIVRCGERSTEIYTRILHKILRAIRSIFMYYVVTRHGSVA
jgi:hypothetical protein